jgi:hypothetical protein
VVERERVSSSGGNLLQCVWKSWAPLNVKVFSWNLLQDRVPARHNLLVRRFFVDPKGTLCSICGVFVESASAVFVTCPFFSRGWYILLGREGEI